MISQTSTYEIAHEHEQDHEYDVLAHIHQAKKVRQREIADAVGMSLGMTNSILKRLAAKGLVMLKRINSRNIHYLVTPSGVDHIMKRSYRYLRRTVGQVARYRDAIRHAIHEAAKETEIQEVLLVGESDLDFLVEWAAFKEGLVLRRAVESDTDKRVGGNETPRSFVVLSERIAHNDERTDEHVGADLLLASLPLATVRSTQESEEYTST